MEWNGMASCGELASFLGHPDSFFLEGFHLLPLSPHTIHTIVYMLHASIRPFDSYYYVRMYVYITYLPKL